MKKLGDLIKTLQHATREAGLVVTGVIIIVESIITDVKNERDYYGKNGIHI